MGDRPANREVDRPCNDCRVPMIGIMIFSDNDGYSAPRLFCVYCTEEIRKEIESV